MTLFNLLKTVVEKNASDLYLISGSPPAFRVDGQVVRAKSRSLSTEEVRKFCSTLLNEAQKETLEKERNIKLNIRVKNISRFKVFIFYQQRSVAGIFRRLEDDVPDFKSLNMPRMLNKVKKFPSGLILVIGPKRSGKSTTVASIVNQINQERRSTIVTLEDPIEYIYKQKKSLIIQEEIGTDVNSLKMGLSRIVEQNCDVCVVDELKDAEMVETVLNLCEAGHLIFTTLSLKNTQRAINHLISIFSSEHQWRIRNQLSENLNAVINQRLIRSLDGGLISAVEAIILNTGIKNLIQEDKLSEIHSLINQGDESLYFCTMNQSLMNLVIKRKIDLRNAFEVTENPLELDEMLKKVGI